MQTLINPIVRYLHVVVVLLFLPYANSNLTVALMFVRHL